MTSVRERPPVNSLQRERSKNGLNVLPPTSAKKLEFSGPTNIPDYVANPQVFDPETPSERILRSFQGRSQQLHNLDTKNPHYATVESTESVRANVLQLKAELERRGVTPEVQLWEGKPVTMERDHNGHITYKYAILEE